MQKKLFDIGWSDERHRRNHCPEWYEVRREIPEAFHSEKWEQRARTSKEEWQWQRGIVAHPLSESQWNRRHFSMKKWESEKHKGWGMPAEGFKGHVATDGSHFGTAGKWSARGWSVVQMDYDEELGLLHGMYGSMEAALEVQRTIKRAEQRHSQKKYWTHQKCMSTTKELLMGCGE